MDKNDCMILFLEEWEDPYKYSKLESEKPNSLKVDTRAYVVYDANTKTYIVYGKRRNTPNGGISEDYTLYFYKAKNVLTYFEYALCTDNDVSYSVYSYNDLVEYGEAFEDRYDYYDFHRKKCSNRELFAYDGNKFKQSKKDILRLLNLIKNEALARLYIEEPTKQ
jgi:hypothetical protein